MFVCLEDESLQHETGLSHLVQYYIPKFLATQLLVVTDVRDNANFLLLRGALQKSRFSSICAHLWMEKVTFNLQFIAVIQHSQNVWDDPGCLASKVTGIFSTTHDC